MLVGAMPVRHWLMKSEPEVFSIDDLAKAKTTFWDGVRNYQARNLMRDDMKPGDLVLFYHSNAKPPGVAGVAEVVKAARPDPSQFDTQSDKFDPASTKKEPRWFGVDIKFNRKFDSPVSLDTIKTVPLLADMILVKRSRLSVQPVSPTEFATIEKLAAAQKRTA